MIEQEERRRSPTQLTQEQLTHIVEAVVEKIGEEIAEKAADKALEKMESKIYQQVGKTFITRFTQLVGAIILGLAIWLNSKGLFKIEG